MFILLIFDIDWLKGISSCQHISARKEQGNTRFLSAVMIETSTYLVLSGIGAFVSN